MQSLDRRIETDLKGAGGAKFSEGARFLGANMFFCKRVNYLYHNVYTNIFDIRRTFDRIKKAESMTLNDHGPIYPYKHAALLSTFLNI